LAAKSARDIAAKTTTSTTLGQDHLKQGADVRRRLKAIFTTILTRALLVLALFFCSRPTARSRDEIGRKTK
jgi:hypothetical protein